MARGSGLLERELLLELVEDTLLELWGDRVPLNFSDEGLLDLELGAVFLLENELRLETCDFTDPSEWLGDGLLSPAGDTLLLLELADEDRFEDGLLEPGLLDPCCCGDAQGSGDDRLCGPAGDRFLDPQDRSEDTTDELPDLAGLPEP